MRMYRALLIGNGEKVSASFLTQLARQTDVILAVDGGADSALCAHITPDYVLGDLDSVSARAKKAFAENLLHVSTQENTDLEKALLWALAHHVTHATLVGFVGDRWDFSLGNLLTLSAYARKLTLCAAGERWRMYALVKSAQIPCEKNKRFSLIPLKPCTGVTLSGCKYALKNARILPGTTRTLSNQTTAAHVGVKFTRGALLVYVEN